LAKSPKTLLKQWKPVEKALKKWENSKDSGETRKKATKALLTLHPLTWGRNSWGNCLLFFCNNARKILKNLENSSKFLEKLVPWTGFVFKDLAFGCVDRGATC